MSLDRSRRRRAVAVPFARTALLALLLSLRTTCALLPSSPFRFCRPPAPSTHLRAKPSKKSKSKSGGGFGASGGFGSKKSSASAPADPSKVRSVSGYTGSGTKVLASAANNFDRIRKLFGKEATTDVYVRSPLNDESTFWFVGKVIRMVEGSESDDELVGAEYPTEAEAILSQKRLILEYAKNQLRPQNMGGPYSKSLELWSAPGDSEMDVVQNKVALVPIAGSSKSLREGFNVNDVGYNPEIYVGEEREKGGLRVVRDAEGRPVKPAFEVGYAPSGGYKKIDFGRYLPDRGPKGWQLWAGATTLILYGYYQIGKTNQARVQQKMQERKVRYALMPLMQAEADREYMERELVNLRREAEIMKDVVDQQGNKWVPGSSQFFGGQWMPRKIGHFMPKY